MEPRAPHPDATPGGGSQTAAAGICVGAYRQPRDPAHYRYGRRIWIRSPARRAMRRGRWFGGGPLFLMPCARRVFLPFLEAHYPHLVPKYRALYRYPYLGASYKETAAPPHSRDPRPLQPGLGPARLQARAVGRRRASHVVSAIVGAWSLPSSTTHLPPELIAQEPLPDRAASRMLVVRRSEGRWEDRMFREFPAFRGAGRLPRAQRFARVSCPAVRPPHGRALAAHRQEESEATRDT